ncbi:DNA segregation ATPase [Bifidobacterium italicum]|uniref:DNA segregation ATPase n=1 Tax=Bifidobacterium italicum TaxID=1960968 RepID=A0A2A2ED42_9BIFI|nr:FtsK/SpoIIIE domain-containing protein [Bifidobacterium italicum]PAU66828.1 DNA segregation ATPase [Bifidobacterium italicum]
MQGMRPRRSCPRRSPPCSDSPTTPPPFRSIAHRWCVADAGCSAPVGVDASGRAAVIDLARFGPHAIVAGTTGAGKSVLLQDWCLALACRYPPRRVQFALLDFKGGSAMDALAGLPHVRGCVNDLDLAYAKRALLALERELTRRELLAARLGVADLMDAPDPPARLVVVVDEFHMLTGQLPDVADRLTRIASLGRSLGMHLIVCTQNPLGEIGAPMKANMALRICLRVRDAMQSQEMLGVDDAARLRVTEPGAAIARIDDGRVRLRCAADPDPARLVAEIGLAARVHAQRDAPPLFTSPLPRLVHARDVGAPPGAIVIGLEDDGVATAPCLFDPADGNLAVIGRPGRGRTTLLETIGGGARACGADVVCLDDADVWFDPLSADPRAARVQELVCAGRRCVVFALGSSRRLRVPDHCGRRLVFPVGERAVDLADGIPAAIVDALTAEDLRTPGRGVLIEAGRARIVQCAVR